MRAYVETVEPEYGSDYCAGDLGYYATCPDCGWDGAVFYLAASAELDAKYHRCGMGIWSRRVLVTIMFALAAWALSGFYPFSIWMSG